MNLHSSHTVPKRAPPNIRCSSTGPKSLVLSWNQLSQAEARGVVNGYRVSYQPLSDGETFKQKSVMMVRTVELMLT